MVARVKEKSTHTHTVELYYLLSILAAHVRLIHVVVCVAFIISVYCQYFSIHPTPLLHPTFNTTSILILLLLFSIILLWRFVLACVQAIQFDRSWCHFDCLLVLFFFVFIIYYEVIWRERAHGFPCTIYSYWFFGFP